MSNAPRCLACGGVQLTEATSIRATNAGIHCQFAIDDGSWMGGTIKAFMVGRICLDCGYVMAFARTDLLTELREKQSMIKR